jgi:drug/metabolite transporter (DMT)-like permease
MGDHPDGVTRCIAFSVVSVMVMIVTALAAAVLYGAGAAMEQRQAAAAPQAAAGRPRLLLLLARNPLWLLGIAAQVSGFAAHAVALRSGPLATVQMLVAGELIVAVIIVRVWSGRPLSRGSWAAALTVVLAVAAFLALTSPGHGHGHGAVAGSGHPDYGVAAALGAAMSGGAALVAAAVGLRASGRSRGLLLAVAAGLADTCSAVVTMAFAYVASHGPAALLTSWTVYAVAVCGAGNVLLTQTAYQAGRPMLTLPVIAAVTPVTSVAIGIGLLGETPRTGVPGAAAACLAVLVASVALACLARSAPHAEPSVPPAEPSVPQPRVSPAEPERVTISPSLAIRLRAGRRLLPAHSCDDRP